MMAMVTKMIMMVMVGIMMMNDGSDDAVDHDGDCGQRMMGTMMVVIMLFMMAKVTEWSEFQFEEDGTVEAASLRESLAGHAFLKESRSSLEQRASEGLMQIQGSLGASAVEGLHSLLISLSGAERQNRCQVLKQESPQASQHCDGGFDFGSKQRRACTDKDCDKAPQRPSPSLPPRSAPFSPSAEAAGKAMYGLNAILSRNSYVSWGNGRDFIFTGNRDFQGGRQCWLQHDGTSSAPVAKPRPPAVKTLSKGTGPLAGSRRKLEQSVEYWRSLGRHDTMEDAFVDAAITRVMQKPRPKSAIATRRPTPRPSKRPELKASPWAAWRVQPEDCDWELCACREQRT
ncbi:unnamed protein product [Symbiodinium microadriaticum]|nr:unnamed protein product [Symbiodinium microadriaticum]